MLARLLITGAVQGVGFRSYVHRVATRLQLAGSVRNLADGSVEVLADGPNDAVLLLYQACLRGPQEGLVAQVKLQKNVQVDAGTTFKIIYE